MSYLVYSPFGRTTRRRRMPDFFDTDFPFSKQEVWVPIDVKAGNDEFIITALVPGLKPEDLNVQVVNETVTISGEIKLDKDEKANYLHKECPSGKFNRIISLPSPLNPAKAEAHIENGVLTLKVPKAEEAKAKTIKVNVAK